MSYNYHTERSAVFLEENQEMFLKIYNNAIRLCKEAGCARMDKITSGCTGLSWTMLACVDRMVEMRTLREIQQGDVAGQHRIFVWDLA